MIYKVKHGAKSEASHMTLEDVFKRMEQSFKEYSSQEVERTDMLSALLA